MATHTYRYWADRPTLYNLHIRLFLAERYRLTPKHWRASHLRDSFWRLYVNQRDGAELTLNDRTFALSAGLVHFVPAGVEFGFYCCDVIENFYMHFDVLGLPYVATKALFSEPIAVLESEALAAKVWDIGKHINHTRTINMPIQFQLKAVIYEGLAQYLHTIPESQLSRSSQLTSDQKRMLPALEYIEKHLAVSISNKELAQTCNLNETYFIRCFREALGATPAKYILKRRVDVAAQQLLFSSDSIDQIAVEAGFSNRFYFARAFSQHMGISPAAYRKATR